MAKYSSLVDTITVDLANKTVIQGDDELDQRASDDVRIASRDKKKRNMQIEAMIEIILEVKNSKGTMQNPCGLVLNRDKVSVECSFDKVNKILGKGVSAGEVILVRDKRIEQDLAYKTIMLTEFTADEIRAWVSLADQERAPELYHFKRIGKKVEFTMELLPGKTLQQVIDGEVLFTFGTKMVKNFAICVLDDLLRAYQKMSVAGFVHGDMHGGNVMLTHSDGSIKIKLIDFGKTRELISLGVNDKIQRVKNDIVEIIRIFCLLYSGADFDDSFDAKEQLAKRNLSKLSVSMDCLPNPLPEAERRELFTIMKMLFDTVRDPTQEGFGDTSKVAAYVNKKLPPDYLDELKKVVVVCLSPGKYKNETDEAYECEIYLDSADGSKDNIPIWDDPNMNEYVRNVTVKDIKKFDDAGSFF